ncbi:MAG: preprotein translocase subunit SecE [Actinomycetota bacterium]|nr:preprotein translocase subunit SecE [Actinomycetota bacterium]
MARPPRTRRGKRSSDFQAPAAPATQRARDRRRQVKPVQQAKSQTGAQRERQGGVRVFAGESYAELRKVEWPGRRQLVSASVVVLIAIAVVGAYLAATDFLFSRLVRDVLLRF